MAIETGHGFIVLHVDLENPEAEPRIEIDGISIWAALVLLDVASDQLRQALPDACIVKVNRATGVEFLVAGPEERDEEEEGENG